LPERQRKGTQRRLRMPGTNHVRRFGSEPLVTRRLLLLPLLSFLFLFFLLRRLRLCLLLLRRRRRFRRCRRRRALLRTFGRRRSLRMRSRLVPVRRGLIIFRTSRFGTIVRLGRRRTIHLRLVGLRTVRLRCRRTICFRSIARLCCFRSTIWLIHCRTIVRLCRRGLIRLWGWTIRLNRIRRSGPLGRSRRIAWPIHRLVCGRCGLTRPRSVRRVARPTHIRCSRFSWRRLLHHWVRRRRIGRTRRLHFASRQSLSEVRCQSLLLFRKRHRRRGRSLLGDHLPVRYRRWRSGHATRRRSFRAQNTLSRRSHRNPRTHWRRGDLACTHRNRHFRHRLRAHERVLRNHHHRALDIPVGVCDVRNIRCVVDDGCVVDVGDGSDVDRRIADVDAIHVCLA